METWNSLDPRWQHAMRSAVEAYLDGSAPIGAVLFDAAGRLVSKGASDFRNDRLAHAEINALTAVPPDVSRSTLSLYSTMEPCPMCTGAIRMMQVRSLSFAARDPAAGSAELLTATRFMRHFPCEVEEPSNPLLEFVNVAMTLEYRTRIGHKRWRDEWHSYLPAAVEAGEKLARDNIFTLWQKGGCTEEHVFNEVSSYAQQ